MRMMVRNETGASLPALSLSRVGAADGRSLRLPRTAEASVTFVSPATMRAVNRRTRGEDRAADVLAFPLHARRPYAPDPDGRVRLGDVLVCPAGARRRAAAEGMPFRDALRLLVVHGLLHLVGYTHGTPRSARRMERMAARLLSPPPSAPMTRT